MISLLAKHKIVYKLNQMNTLLISNIISHEEKYKNATNIITTYELCLELDQILQAF